jgi:hypothetical protein
MRMWLQAKTVTYQVFTSALIYMHGLFLSVTSCRNWGVVCGTFGACAQDGRTALMRAANSGHKDCVRLLLDAGANKNAKDRVRGGSVWYVDVVCVLISM